MQLTITTHQAVAKDEWTRLVHAIEELFSTKGILFEIIVDSPVETVPRESHQVERIDIDDSIMDYAETHDHYPEVEKRLDDEWALGAAQSLARAYGPDEPEYDVSMLKRANPDYDPR